VDPGQEGETALMAAVTHGHHAVADLLTAAAQAQELVGTVRPVSAGVSANLASPVLDISLDDLPRSPLVITAPFSGPLPAGLSSERMNSLPYTRANSSPVPSVDSTATHTADKPSFKPIPGRSFFTNFHSFKICQTITCSWNLDKGFFCEVAPSTYDK